MSWWGMINPNTILLFYDSIIVINHNIHKHKDHCTIIFYITVRMVFLITKQIANVRLTIY